jgi:hypothetical protein
VLGLAAIAARPTPPDVGGIVDTAQAFGIDPAPVVSGHMNRLRPVVTHEAISKVATRH